MKISGKSSTEATVLAASAPGSHELGARAITAVTGRKFWSRNPFDMEAIKSSASAEDPEEGPSGQATAWMV